MMDWLAEDRPPKIFGALVTVAALVAAVDIVIGLVGGSHAAFTHEVPAGYVGIHTMIGYGAAEVYVSPRLANLHSYALWTVGTSIGLALVLGVARKFSLARKPKENSN